MGKYTGLFPALKNVASTTGPIIYASIAQTYNDQRLAFALAIIPSVFISLIPLAMTDFSGGAVSVEKEGVMVRTATIQMRLLRTATNAPKALMRSASVVIG